MDFITLHDLSVRFDITIKALRRRLTRLIDKGVLQEGRDFRREDYLGPNHFVWKIDPEAFGRAAGLVAKPRPEGAPAGAEEAVQSPPRPAVAAPQPVQTLPNVDTQGPALHREFIDVLKGQLASKDEQIRDLSAQNRELTELNAKLNGAVVFNTRAVLRLTMGADALAEMADNGEPPAAAGAADDKNAGGMDRSAA